MLVKLFEKSLEECEIPKNSSSRLSKTLRDIVPKEMESVEEHGTDLQCSLCRLIVSISFL